MAVGIWDLKTKRFVFGIKAETHAEAWRQFGDMVGWQAAKSKYEARCIPKNWVNPKNPIKYR